MRVAVFLIIFFCTIFTIVTSDDANDDTDVMTCSADDSECINDRQNKFDKEYLFPGAAIMLAPLKPFEARRKCTFNMSMDALATYWRPNNNYPVILMNTRPWLVKEMKTIRLKWPSLDILFEDVTTIFESFPKPGFVMNQMEENRISVLGMIPFSYKRMCAFFTWGFTQVPLLQDYRYLLRLDDDSCIQNMITFDIFRDMEIRKAAYAYQGLLQDLHVVTRGLHKFTKKYMKANSLKWSNPLLHKISTEKYPNIALQFATNFEVIDMKRYSQSDIMQFTDAIMATNMTFHRRWGDAPIRFLIAKLFWRDDEVMRICEFEYYHGNTVITFEMCNYRHTKDAVVRTVLENHAAGL